jgi:predicted kinase
LYVLVNGMPAAGKSSIARPLARSLDLPLISKDVIKDALLDSFAVSDRAASIAAGRASIRIMYSLARDASAAVLDCNFERERARADLDTLGGPIYEIYCRCPLGTVQQRFLDRQDDRHPGHRIPDVPAALQEWASKYGEPLGVGPVLEVDTSRPVAIDEIIEWVTAQETAH